jgi:hypothetical protein
MVHWHLPAVGPVGRRFVYSDDRQNIGVANVSGDIGLAPISPDIVVGFRIWRYAMATVTLKRWDLWQYQEVWEITEWKDGTIKGTRSTGRFISLDNLARLDRQKYTVSPVSARRMGAEDVTLELFEVK